MKAQALKKNNLLTLHRGGERFDGLGGLANLKQFCARALRPGRPVRPRGVATRMFGNVLTWLSDHASNVFFVGTSNDVSRLPPEFARAERFDGLFFLDLPAAAEQYLIWQLYRRQLGIPDSQARPDDTSWTGAEIKSCCRLAALLDVSLTQAAHHVVPVAVTAAEQVERLRSWASGRCLSASAPGVYRRDGETAPKSGRRVQRGGSNN